MQIDNLNYLRNKKITDNKDKITQVNLYRSTCLYNKNKFNSVKKNYTKLYLDYHNLNKKALNCEKNSKSSN